jgi:hypothetical protein
MNPSMLQVIAGVTPVRGKSNEENHLSDQNLATSGRCIRTSYITCCLPPMLFMTPAVLVVANPVAGAN